MLDRELKRGSTEMLILALVEDRPRHGYEIAKLIEQRSEGVLQFHAASLYPLLYRLEKRGLIKGRWVEKASQRRRRFYNVSVAQRGRIAAIYFTVLAFLSYETIHTWGIISALRTS